MRSWATLAGLASLLACGGGGSGGELSAGLETGETGEEGGEGLDEARLDRSESGGLCGYPGPGPGGYGTEVGQRIANFGHPEGTTIIDCEGNEIEFADFLCERSEYAAKYPNAAPSEYEAHNKAILVSIGAGWCEPCIEETEELMPQVFDPLYGDGLEIVQILFQDDDAQPPPKSFCQQWRDERFPETLQFFVGLDQTFGWADEFLLMPESSTPVTMLIDANANIRYKLEGEKPKSLADEARLVMANPYGD